MRPTAPVLAASALLLMAVAVLVGGRLVIGQTTPVETIAPVAAVPADPVTSAIARPPPQKLPPAISRPVAPSMVAPSGPGDDELQREAPRQPLSKLSLALPPKPPKPLLFQPVANAAGVIETGGRTITIDGIVPVGSDETCTAPSGGDWPCGRAARTAFRAFLRGRAVTCDFQAEELAGDVTSTCRLGGQDAGAWLVSNGWARAAPDGPYVEAEATARAEKTGIFGPPPDTSALPSVPAYEALTPPVDQPAPSE